MGISVIIPSLNEEANISRAIGSVRAFADEVIVADGGSTDATIRLAKDNGARVVTCVEPGRGRQLRLGAEAANEDLLLFLHADNWLDEQAADQILHIAQTKETQSSAVFGCFRQRIDDPRFRFRLLEAGNAFRAQRLATPYGDQAIFVDRQTYDNAEGFDDVPLMEDVMLSQRIRKLTPPTLLNGPVHLSARRWKTDGVLFRTLRNWFIFTAFQCGVPPKRLARWYG